MLLFTTFVLVTLFSTITPSSELEAITSSIGKETTIEKFPWQVSLVTPSLDHFCGGSIIDETTILTSGECLVRLSKTDRQALYIRVGSTNLYEGGETVNAKGIIVHEHFSIPSKQNNDIGLVILNSSLVYTEKIRPVLLPRPMSTFRPNETVLVSGWGSESDDGEELTDQLHFVSLQSIEQRVCRRVYQDTVDFNYIITNKMICAGFPNFDKENLCQVSARHL